MVIKRNIFLRFLGFKCRRTALWRRIVFWWYYSYVKNESWMSLYILGWREEPVVSFEKCMQSVAEKIGRKLGLPEILLDQSRNWWTIKAFLAFTQSYIHIYEIFDFLICSILWSFSRRFNTPSSILLSSSVSGILKPIAFNFVSTLLNLLHVIISKDSLDTKMSPHQWPLSETAYWCYGI